MYKSPDTPSKEYVFFLGGKDAEMLRIKDILQENGIAFHDKELGWGAKASAYKDEISATLEEGKTPVIIELERDISLPDTVIDIDHHGKRASEPPSVMQVLALLNKEPSRWDLLIAANDADYIPGMEALGATVEEIAEIRAIDRQCQGITPEQEAQAEAAISNAEQIGDMLVVRVEHSKSAAITDRLHEKQAKQHILILSGDGEINYFAAGGGATCRELQATFGGWAGGSGLDKNEGNALGGYTKIWPTCSYWYKNEGNAFWGGYADQEQVLGLLTQKALASAKEQDTHIPEGTPREHAAHSRAAGRSAAQER